MPVNKGSTEKAPDSKGRIGCISDLEKQITFLPPEDREAIMEILSRGRKAGEK